MCTDASKDALAHAADDASRITDRFIYAELDIFLAKEEGLTAEEERAGLGGKAGAGATLGEEKSNGFVEERLRGHPKLRSGSSGTSDASLGCEPGERGALEVVGLADDPLYLARAEVRQCHEMGNRLFCCGHD